MIIGSAPVTAPPARGGSRDRGPARARLRRRLAHALRRSPLEVTSFFARYAMHRRALSGQLDALPLDDFLRTLDASARPRLVRPRELDLELLLVASEALLRRLPAPLSPPSTCLYRAIARYAMAVELGFTPTLVIGLRPDAAVRPAASISDDVLGHAWIEIDGAPVPREAISSYVVSMRHTRQAGVIR